MSWQDYNIDRGKEAGFQMFPGFRPRNAINRTRQNVGLYVFAEAEWTARLLIGTALRYERYNNFGGRLIGRVYGRYKFSDYLVLKSSWNSGFRAPSMPQIYFNTLSSQYISTGSGHRSIRVAHYNNESLVTKEFGIEPLEAERSTNVNFGLVARPIDGLSIALNAYQIDISNRIVITGRFASEDDPSFAKILDPLGVGRAQFFTNAVQTRTRGLEGSLNYQYSIGKGRLDISASFSVNKTRLGRNEDGSILIQTSDVLQAHQETLFNREEISRLESVQPSSKIFLGLKYGSGFLDIGTQATRYGTVEYIHPSDGNIANWQLNQYSGVEESRDQTFGSKWLIDAYTRFILSDALSFTLGGANLFNTYPDRQNHSANVSNGLFPYSRRVQQFNIRGTFWYTRLGYRF